ncbi:hypothetical protein LC085_10800 [Bacillus tianshenii]|uniref:hypothetical protein n=1 Tax=Sutcliffiella tianshenii TaxID=1463404 RepID=UPI001CD7CF6F|nr:hypothetical protein [Bacillus tianshenii]MCA1320398.1 hypothetical protein [Bacillus tianshenii]
MEKQLKNLNKDMNQLLLKNIKVSSEEKDRILQGIQAKKRRKSPIGYYAALVAAAAIICLFTLSQLDFLKKDPGMSDDDPPIVEPQEDEPAEVPEVVPEVEDNEPEVPVVDEKDYTTSPTLYMDESGAFKLKTWRDFKQGIGIGDSMQEVLDIYGEPNERFENDVNPDSEIFKYHNQMLDSLTIIFTEGEEPKIESINAFYKYNPIEPLSFPAEWNGTILDLVSNFNVYGEMEILFFQKQDKLYNVKLLDKSNHQDEEEMKVAYDATELTLQEYLDRVIDKEYVPPTGEVADEDVPALVAYLVEKINKVYDDKGEELNWDYDDPADFEYIRPELRKYVSQPFTDGHLKEISNRFFRDGHGGMIPALNFDIRKTIIENTNSKIIISTIEIAGMDAPSTVYFTLVKEDDRWILGSWERIDVEKTPINITWEEYSAYHASWGEKLTLINEVTHDGEKIYVFTTPTASYVQAIEASTSIPIEAQEEWIPEDYRED